MTHYWLEAAEIDAFYEADKDYYFTLYNDWRQGKPFDQSSTSEAWREIISEALSKLDPSNPNTDSRDIAAHAYRIYKLRQAAAVINAGSLGICPKCGDPGKFIRGALCCPQHGAYAGI